MSRYIFFIMFLFIAINHIKGDEFKAIPDLSKVGVLKKIDSHGFNSYVLQTANTGTKEMYLGTNKDDKSVGRIHLVFDLSNIPAKSTITSAELVLKSSNSPSYTFSKMLALYRTFIELDYASNVSWDQLAPINGYKIMDLDMDAAGQIRHFQSATLKDMVKGAFGDKLRLNILHNNENVAGMVLDASGENYLYLRVVYTPPVTTPDPAKVEISGPASLKSGERGNYTANYTGSSTPSTYIWSVSNSNLNIISGAGTKNVVVEATATSAATSTLKVTAEGVSASKSISITSDDIKVTGNITSDKNYTGRNISVVNATISNKAKVNMTATQSVIISPSTYFQSGTTVIIKATGGTTRSLVSEYLDFDDDATEIESDLIVEELTIYPIPVKDKLTVDLGHNFDSFSYLEVYNLTGLMIEKQLVNNYQETVDVNSYSEGVYILRIIYKNGESQVKRFMVKK